MRGMCCMPGSMPFCSAPVGDVCIIYCAMSLGWGAALVLVALVWPENGVRARHLLAA